MSKGPLASTAPGMPHHARFGRSFENEAETPTSEGPVATVGCRSQGCQSLSHTGRRAGGLSGIAAGLSKSLCSSVQQAQARASYYRHLHVCGGVCAEVYIYDSQRVIWKRCFLPYGSQGPNTGCQCGASILTSWANSAALFLSETGS